MSNDSQKADQIAFHFYTKLFYVVNQARATAEARGQPKLDKWFNLETPDSDLFTKEAREPYKNISQARPPPLEIQVVLAVPELANNQVLVYLTPESSRARIEPTPRYIVLETWTLSFAPRRPDEDQSIDVALPTIYKHGIPLFRSLYTLLRVLPTWKLYRRLKRRGSHNLSIHLRVRGDDPDHYDSLDFDVPPSPSLSTPLATQNHTFSSVPHPLGTLTLSARYLEVPNFQLEELESVLSSRFISQDLDLGGGDGFVPTLMKRTTGAASTSDESVTIAERFILPVARTPSNPSSSVRNIPQPPRQLASGEYAGVLPSQSPSGLAISRLRKESIGSSSSPSASLSVASPFAGSASVSSSPSTGPLPIRRPSINPVHPFKSNTVSSASGSSPSLSIRQTGLGGSPLTTAGTHSRATSISGRHPPSPIGVGFAGPNSRPSPPGAFAPSSLDVAKRPGTSGSPGSGGSSEYHDKRSSLGAPPVGSSPDDQGRVAQGLPPRKRYSSSFGHRYANSVGSGEGGGSVSGRSTPAIPPSMTASGLGIEGLGIPRERKESSTGLPVISSFMSNNTDDDDISVFVQDIDSRKPLSGRWKEREKRDWERQQQRQQFLKQDGADGSLPVHIHDRYASEASDASTVKPQRPFMDRHDSYPSSGRTSLSPTSTAPSSRFSTTSNAMHVPGNPSTLSPPSRDHSAPVGVPLSSSAAMTSVSPPTLSLSPTRGPMLTSQSEVEERLRKMNETFFKSLEGFGSGSGNAAKRKEREQKKREKEKERERTSSTGTHASLRKQSSGTTASPTSPSDDSSTPTTLTATPSASSLAGNHTHREREAEDRSDGQLTSYASRGLSIRPHRERERDRLIDTFGAPPSTLNYTSLGLGLRRRAADDEVESGPDSSGLAAESTSDLGHSVGISQGSEEVIGKMDLYSDRESERSRSRGYRHRYG